MLRGTTDSTILQDLQSFIGKMRGTTEHTMGLLRAPSMPLGLTFRLH